MFMSNSAEEDPTDAAGKEPKVGVPQVSKAVCVIAFIGESGKHKTVLSSFLPCVAKWADLAKRAEAVKERRRGRGGPNGATCRSTGVSRLAATAAIDTSSSDSLALGEDSATNMAPSSAATENRAVSM